MRANEKRERDARRTVSIALEEAVAREPTVVAEGKVLRGDVACVLISEAEAALAAKKGEVLLVVGSSMRGTLAVRSVGHELLHHAPCPVTIARGGPPPPGDPPSPASTRR